MRVEGSVVRITGQRLHQTEHVTVGCASAFREEEGWIDEDVHRLLPAESGDSEEQVSSSADRRALQLASGCSALFEDRLEIGIPSATS